MSDDDDEQLKLPFPTWFTIDEGWLSLPEEPVMKKNGLHCKKCKEFFNYAESNQTDGSLICWACRNNY